MKSKTQTQVIAGIVILVLVIGTWATGSGWQIKFLRFYSAAVLVASLALTLWDRVIWHLNPVQKLSNVPRDVRGTWKGVLASDWKDPTTGVGVAAKDVFLAVRQTSSTVRVSLYTDESQSHSSIGSVSVGDEPLMLEYMYFNRPSNALEHRSRRHNGSTALDITGRPASRLKGHYWTDRDTKGELVFEDHVQKRVDDYESAKTLFQSEQPSKL